MTHHTSNTKQCFLTEYFISNVSSPDNLAVIELDHNFIYFIQCFLVLKILRAHGRHMSAYNEERIQSEVFRTIAKTLSEPSDTGCMDLSRCIFHTTAVPALPLLCCKPVQGMIWMSVICAFNAVIVVSSSCFFISKAILRHWKFRILCLGGLDLWFMKCDCRGRVVCDHLPVYRGLVYVMQSVTSSTLLRWSCGDLVMGCYLPIRRGPIAVRVSVVSRRLRWCGHAAF